MMKKTNDWTEFLGESALPADEFTFTTGNNFGLDGFQFDEPDNQGPEDGGRLPTTRGLSGLPDGLVVDAGQDLSFQDLTDDSESGLGINMTAMLSAEEGGLDRDSSIIDLQWMDPTQEPDHERLPNNKKKLNSIPQLEKAWGRNRPTNGLTIVPNTDKERADYEASLKAPAKSGKTAEEVKHAVLRALRRAHYGESINSIHAELVETLGHESYRAASAMRIIKEEHGLIGKVFIRANAFPGIKNGKWLDKIHKSAHDAHYVITEDQAVADKLGMVMVSEIPWKEALEYYAPRLTASGYKVASVGNAKDILRRAFRVGPTKASVPEQFQPVVKPVIASHAEAQAALKAPVIKAPLPKTAEEQSLETKRKAALVRIARWVQAGKITQSDAIQLNASGASAEELLEVGAALVTATGEYRVYDGDGTTLPDTAMHARKAALRSLDELQAGVEANIKRKFSAYLGRVVKSGLLTAEERGRIESMNRPVAELERLIAAAVQMARQHRQASVEVPDIKSYMGHAYTAYRPVAQAEFSKASIASIKQRAAAQEAANSDDAIEQRVAAKKAANSLDKLPDNRKKMPEAVPAKKYADTQYTAIQQVSKVTPNITEHEFRALRRWARQKMAEGSMGQELSEMLKVKFPLPIRKAAREDIKDLRATHEGLSGHLYVDAAAYASKNGTTGCEEGALKHRANGIKHVLAMSRCAGCTFANADGVCSQYNKKLATREELPVKNIKKYQARAIELANADESEVTASLFNPKEFDLRNEGIEDVRVADEHHIEILGDLTFGGMEVE